MTGKFLLVVIAVCALGGIVGGLVMWGREEPSAIQAQDSTTVTPSQPPTIIIQSAPPPPEKPRAKSHYIKPGQVDRI